MISTNVPRHHLSAPPDRYQIRSVHFNATHQ
jgi:hypothetical protein